MNFRMYILSIVFGTTLCFFAWFSIILHIDPEEGGIIAFGLFYSTLFLGLVGLISTGILLVKKLLLVEEEVVFRHIKRIFRQSFIFTFLLVVTLVLLQLEYLRWWNGIILIALGIVLEGMVYTNRKYSNQDYVR